MLTGRIRDAVKTLLGRSEAQQELARMRAQFTDLMIDISSALEKLNTMAARLAKRETRALEKASGVTAEGPPQLPAPTNGGTGKSDLYRRLNQLKQERRAG